MSKSCPCLKSLGQNRKRSPFSVKCIRICVFKSKLKLCRPFFFFCPVSPLSKTLQTNNTFRAVRTIPPNSQIVNTICVTFSHQRLTFSQNVVLLSYQNKKEFYQCPNSAKSSKTSARIIISPNRNWQKSLALQQAPSECTKGPSVNRILKPLKKLQIASA